MPGTRFDNSLRYRPESHDRQAWLTPGPLLEAARQWLGGIDTDPCTEPSNPTGARHYFALPGDGCMEFWTGNVWCNPPYGRARQRWIERCVEHSRSTGHRTLLLIPAATETRPFQLALRECRSVLFLPYRLKFGLARENGRELAATHGSALFSFGWPILKAAPESKALLDLGGVLMVRP